MKDELRQQIQAKIADNKLADALDQFLNWATAHDDQDLQNTLYLMKGQFNRLKENERLNIIPLTDALREQSRITHALLSTLENVPRSDKGAAEAPGRGRPSAPEADSETHTILFLASNPSKTAKLQLDKEFVQIFDSLQNTPDSFQLKAEWAVRPEQLQKAILTHKPHILHFSGHGEGDNGPAGGEGDRGIAIDRMIQEEGGIILQDLNGEPQRVSGKALGFMLQNLKRKVPLKMVLLNSCYSDDQAREIARHVPFVIGMDTAVRDAAAIHFAKGFYMGLVAEGDDVFDEEHIDFAFNTALTEVMLMEGDGFQIPRIWVQGEQRENPAG